MHHTCNNCGQSSSDELVVCEVCELCEDCHDHAMVTTTTEPIINERPLRDEERQPTLPGAGNGGK